MATNPRCSMRHISRPDKHLDMIHVTVINLPKVVNTQFPKFLLQCGGKPSLLIACDIFARFSGVEYVDLLQVNTYFDGYTKLWPKVGADAGDKILAVITG